MTPYRVIHISENRIILSWWPLAFPLMTTFVGGFCGSLVSASCVDANPKVVSEFLDKTFLASSKQTSLNSIRYSSRNRILRWRFINLVSYFYRDGCSQVQSVLGRCSGCDWNPPKRMVETVSIMRFSTQRKRDFIPFIWIAGKGFYIIIGTPTRLAQDGCDDFFRAATILRYSFKWWWNWPFFLMHQLE